MKLAIAGKGGAGKTTICGTLARQLARQGYEVLALDNDLNPNLPLTVGVPAERMTDLPTLSADIVKLVDGRYVLNQTIEQIREAHALQAPDGVTVLVAHEPKQADTGCMGRYHVAMRAVVGGAPDSQNHITLLDTEASTEHLKVGTAKHADVLYAVVEPYYKSLESGRRVLALARDLGIEHLALLANKVRDEDDLAAVHRFAEEHDLGVIGAIPYDECFFHAERAAVAPIDYDPRAPAVVALGKLARKLVRG
jgi:CO dehydrogenase maturation factor